MRKQRLGVALCMATVGVLMIVLGAPAHATVYDLTKLADGHASVQYHWTMDDDAAGGFYDDHQGGVDLVQARSSASYAADMVEGLDCSTEAMRTDRPTSDRDTGAALRTASNISLPSTGTVEYLFRADTKNEGGYVAGGMVGPTRHYFGYDRTSEGLTVGFGDPGQFEDLLGGSTTVLYNVGDWYYVAINYAPSGSNTVFNAYVANLSNDDDEATQTITNWSASGTAGGASRFGIGCYGKDGNHYLDGYVDQVAIYNSPLSASDINARVAAIQSAPDLRVDLDCRSYPDVRDQWVADQSSWNNACVLGNSSTTTAYDPTPSAYGFEFDASGAGDELNIKRNSSLQVADIGNNKDFSIEMWLRPDEIVNGRVLVDTRPDTANGWVMWMLADGSLSLKFYQGGSSWPLVSDPGLLVADGIYHHIGVSLDANASAGGEVTFYVDGRPWGTSTYTGAGSYVDSTAPYRIGHQRHVGTTSLTPFDGGIGAFRLHARALTGEEVWATYSAERSGFVPEPATMLLLGGGLLAVARRRRRR